MLALTALFVGVAWTFAAAATYDATCNATGDACLWENGPFVVPLAATTTSDSTYADDTYPNTIDSLNDSASSLKNKFDVHDVIFYTLVGYAGDSVCVDSNSAYDPLSGTYNDKLSSHIVAVGSTC